MTLATAKAELKKAGYTPSDQSWEDEKEVHVYSVETFGRWGFNAPKASITYTKAINYTHRSNC